MTYESFVCVASYVSYHSGARPEYANMRCSKSSCDGKSSLYGANEGGMIRPVASACGAFTAAARRFSSASRSVGVPVQW